MTDPKWVAWAAEVECEMDRQLADDAFNAAFSARFPEEWAAIQALAPEKVVDSS